MLDRGPSFILHPIVNTLFGLGVLFLAGFHLEASTAAGSQTPDWTYVPSAPSFKLSSRVVGNLDANLDGFPDLLIVEPGNGTAPGRVSVFHGGPRGLGASPGQVIEFGPGGGGSHGTASGIGDTDGNGRREVILREYPSEESTEFQAWIWESSPSGLVKVRRWEGVEAVSGFGDFNRDGFADIISRKANTNTNQPPGLCVSLSSGSRDGPATQAAWSVCDEQKFSEFGHDVANAGDVNGDGVDDLIIGSMKFSGAFEKGGKALLYLGSPEGLKRNPGWTSEYPLTPEAGVDGVHEMFFSWGVASAGDVNRDGFADVVVGACFAEQQDVNEGLAFLYLGSPAGLALKPDWMAQAENPNSLFGQSLAGVGDVNGDGYPDVAIGAPEARNGQQSEGVVVVYAGTRHGLSRDPIWIIEGELTHEKMGSSVRAAGDINNDGFADVLMVNADHEEIINDKPVKVGRCVVAYGRAGTRISEGGWYPGKRLLPGLQQRLDIQQSKYGAIIYWGPGLLAILLLGSLSIWLQARSRRRIAQLLEENRRLTTREERIRLARDVHDHLGTDLNMLLLEIKQAATTLETPERTARLLEELTTGCERTINTMGELIWATDPAHDSVEAFLDYLSDYAKEYLEKVGMRCTLDFENGLGSTKLQPAQRHHLYLAAKEAVHNAAKYSKAGTVAITGKHASNLFTLAIQDDGIGFQLDNGSSQESNGTNPAAPRRGGNGLRNLRTRMNLAGGSVSIVSAPNQGTTVRFSIPTQRSDPAKS